MKTGIRVVLILNAIFFALLFYATVFDHPECEAAKSPYWTLGYLAVFLS